MPLESDFDFQINELPLLRFIKEHTELNINIKPEIGMNFDLNKNQYTAKIVAAIILLLAYSLADTLLNQEIYTAAYPSSWFYGIGIGATIFSGIWLRKKSVPKSTAWGLAFFFGLIASISMHPSLLRINQLTDNNGLQDYTYTQTHLYTFESTTGETPNLIMPKDKYWQSLAYNSKIVFSIRKGGLGFYQVDMTPIHKITSKWHCIKRARNNKERLLECNERFK